MLNPYEAATTNNVVMLNPYEAITYINNYRNKFCKRNNKKHTKSIFLNAEYFNFIGEYFREHKPEDADGVRIFFASYHRFLGKAPNVYQAHKKQITFVLAATKDKIAYLDSFNKYADQKGVIRDALNHGELCPNSCDDVTNPEASTANTALSIKPVPLVFLNPDTAKQYIRNYRKRYCRLRNKKHTKSIWIPRDNFEFLYEFFKNDASSKKYAGMRVFFASYNKKIKETCNARKKQITLIFTAALMNSTHEPDFTALLNFYEEYKKRAIKVLDKNENHGELCPNSCNDELSDPI
jgi:hypothetical protein